MSDLQFLSDTSTGRKYNETGQLSPWWTNASIEAFNERAKCYVEQYSKYELFGIHVSDLYIIQSFLCSGACLLIVTFLVHFQINGEQTLGENIADNGGIRVAFRVGIILILYCMHLTDFCSLIFS